MFAQILITKNDLEDYSKQEALKDTMRLALKTNVVLVLNENDVVELHSFGGNDFLAGKVAQLLDADYLLLLTDVDGVYSEEKQILQTINARGVKKLAMKKSERASGNGRVGGIQSKVKAGRVAAQSGIEAIIANGKSKDILLRLILNQEKIGTRISR
jgi:glutamate 5-kinase